MAVSLRLATGLVVCLVACAFICGLAGCDREKPLPVVPPGGSGRPDMSGSGEGPQSPAEAKPPVDNVTVPAEAPPKPAPVAPRPVGAAEPKPPWVEIPEVRLLVVLDRLSGGLLVIQKRPDGHEGAVASLYPREALEGAPGKLVGPVDAASGAPILALFKQVKDKGYFLVTAQRDDEVTVFNAADLSVTGTIETPQAYRASFVSSCDPDDPYAYLVLFNDLYRLDLASMNCEKLLGDLGLDAAWVAGDGRRIYGRKGNAKELWLFEPVADKALKAAWTRRNKLSAKASEVLPGAMGQFVAFDKHLYPADGSDGIVQFPENPACFLKSRPVVIVVENSDIVAYSLNSGREVGRAPCPADFRKASPAAAPPSTPAGPRYRQARPTAAATNPVRVLSDEARDRLVLVSAEKLYLMPIAELKLPEEPWLSLAVEPPARVDVAQALSVPVTASPADAVLELDHGPEGMSVSDGKLTWTPGDGQLGRAQAALRVSSGGFSTTRKLVFTVQRPFIPLDFVPKNARLSMDGRRIVLWNPITTGSNAPELTRIALVDLDKREVVADKKLLYGVKALEIDERHVYVVPSFANRINLLSLEDLGEEKYVETPEPGELLLKTDAGHLVALTTRVGDGPLEFALPGMTEVKGMLRTMPDERTLRDWRRQMLGDLLPGPANRPADVFNPRMVGEVLCVNGCLYRSDLSKAVALVYAVDCPVLPVDRSRPLRLPITWDRYLNNGKLKTGLDREIADVQGGSQIMADIPAAVALKTSRDRSGLLSVSVDVIDLASGKAAKALWIAKDTPTVQRPAVNDAIGRSEGLLSAGRGRRIIVTLGDAVYVLEPDEETLKGLAAPFQLAPPDKMVFVDLAGKTTVKHAVTGGEAPFEFGLNIFRRGLDVDAKTGDVTFDGEFLAKEAAGYVAAKLKAVKQIRQPDRQPMQVKRDVQLFYAEEAIRRTFERMTGYKVDGIPVLIPVGLIASDKNLNVAWTDYYAVIVVPEATLAELLEITPKPEEKKPGTSPARLDDGPRPVTSLPCAW